MSDGIYDSITEQPHIMKRMLNQSKEITRQFVELFRKNQFSRIIMAGSGSSYNAAQSARYFMKKLLKIEIDVQYAHVFAAYEEVINKNSLLIGISQNGESTASVKSIIKAKSMGMANLAVTSEDGSYITEHADFKMVVPTGEEKAGATTKGYTTTVLAFYLAAVETALDQHLLNEHEYKNYYLKLNKLADGLEKVIETANAWYGKHKESLLSAKSLIVSGGGWNFGTALEVDLKFMETS